MTITSSVSLITVNCTTSETILYLANIPPLSFNSLEIEVVRGGGGGGGGEF